MTVAGVSSPLIAAVDVVVVLCGGGVWWYSGSRCCVVVLCGSAAVGVGSDSGSGKQSTGSWQGINMLSL